jgi:hypothetical protein
VTSPCHITSCGQSSTPHVRTCVDWTGSTAETATQSACKWQLRGYFPTTGKMQLSGLNYQITNGKGSFPAGLVGNLVSGATQSPPPSPPAKSPPPPPLSTSVCSTGSGGTLLTFDDVHPLLGVSLAVPSYLLLEFRNFVLVKAAGSLDSGLAGAAVSTPNVGVCSSNARICLTQGSSTPD